MENIFKELKFIDNNQYVDGLIKYTSDISNLPQRTNRALKEIKPNYIFITNNKPTILFFDKNVDRKKVFKQCWNFSEAPIIIIENDTDFDIYNGFDYITKDGEFLLKEIENKSEINYISIISGEYFAKSKDFLEKNINKVDKKLLENIKYARDKLIYSLSVKSLKEKLSKINDTKEKKKKEKIFNSFTPDENENYKQIQHIANALLGRTIFIRYLIDRQIALFYNDKKQKISNDDLKNILSNKKDTYQFFNDLQSSDKGFNGDWFPIDTIEKDIVKEEHLHILKQLISGTDLKTHQGSLFDIYDFSIIPIEFISNVYESFIGEEDQKKDGAYYTPTFLVDYILKHTIDDFFEKNPNEYNCRVLDPACGSGIFLVETLRKLIAQYEKVKNRKIKAEEIVQLVKDNIFGIDKNENALKISVFSLYLTMLDYQSPTDIEEFKFPYLLDSEKNKDKPNFFHNDFFDTKADFNNILEEKELDFIIGNPPYGRGIIKKETLVDEYINTNKIGVGNRDIVQPFMVRVKDLVAKNTTISFIVTSKVLYNLKSKNFRVNHFFNNFKINHILELSSVYQEIFESADVPVSILFYQYCENKKDILENKINYISMKPSPYFEKLKILFISKSDFKKVQQSKVLEYDYLWKILVYGSYLDFNFIKKVKNYKKIKDFVISEAIGITIGNKKNIIPEEYFNLPYIRTKQFKPFLIKENNLLLNEKFAERIRDKDTFKAPSLLIAKGISKQLDLKSAILNKDSIFSGTITSIKTDLKNDLYGIMGFLNSTLFKYFIMHTASSIGVERPQIHNPEKFSLPYVHNQTVIDITKQLELYSKDDFAQYDKEYDKLKEQLNNAVLDALNLSKQEKILIDYTNNIVIPWVIQKKYDKAFEKLKYKDKRIDSYLKIFTEHYTKIYAQINKYFSVNVYWDKYTIGIYFKVLDEEPKEQIEWIEEPNIQNFLKISSGKTLENLFIQKDIKGFETDGFYVIKPNEYKNWHEAIGYLDFYEFEDAILRAGKTNFLSKESKNV